MRDYLVTFQKIVLDGAGRDRRVLQCRARVRARSEVGAAWEAKAIFCRDRGIPDWRLLADTCEVVTLAQSTTAPSEGGGVRPSRGDCTCGARRGEAA